jgi:D-lactate dehydrogenase (cytochrome)
VPISRLAECVTATQEDAAASRFIAPIVGHVGDGNFHLLLMIDLNDPGEIKRAEDLLERLVDRALAMDGTCTGEHGIGQGKMKYLKDEYGAPALDAMRAVKRALDPLDIMNPGKIFNL